MTYSNPLQTSSARDARFWDRVAPGYAKRPVADPAAYARKLEITQSHLRPEMEMLEFGCGTGTTALTHAAHVRHVLAFDVSAQMIAIAEDKAQAQGVENVTFVQNRIEDFEPPEGRYDAVLAMSILHLLKDPRAAVNKSFEMLTPGGTFHSSTVCLKTGMWWFWPIARLGKALGLLPHVLFLGPHDLERMVREAGFEIETSWQPGKKIAIFIVARKPG
ncbi:class I SAM-dependent methyltransferase [Roseobacter sinensis]|uniref:Class I SAM-dependent methyltransferase n=1 Tax=Roseobacter sinensis TaxID=2931391 RepID=A0ABT3BE25_9RHOB|nr:class I SAM-dependent methyltransferase [Roseobacter sp. WL0113]MCV3271818.1 class I SAM-dependent methyltransferase [Roseobacter sp. WL0113]